MVWRSPHRRRYSVLLDIMFLKMSWKNLTPVPSFYFHTPFYTGNRGLSGANLPFGVPNTVPDWCHPLGTLTSSGMVRLGASFWESFQRSGWTALQNSIYKRSCHIWWRMDLSWSSYADSIPNGVVINYHQDILKVTTGSDMSNLPAAIIRGPLPQNYHWEVGLLSKEPACQVEVAWERSILFAFLFLLRWDFFPLPPFSLLFVRPNLFSESFTHSEMLLFLSTLLSLFLLEIEPTGLSQAKNPCLHPFTRCFCQYERGRAT